MGSQMQSNSDESTTFSVDAADDLDKLRDPYEKLKKRSINPKALYRRWSADSGSHSIYHSGFIDELKDLITFLSRKVTDQYTDEEVTKLEIFRRKFKYYEKKRKSSADQVVGILEKLLGQIQPNNALEENSDLMVRSKSWPSRCRTLCYESVTANNRSRSCSAGESETRTRSWSLTPSLSIFCLPKENEDMAGRVPPGSPPPPPTHHIV